MLRLDQIWVGDQLFYRCGKRYLKLPLADALFCLRMLMRELGIKSPKQ